MTASVPMQTASAQTRERIPQPLHTAQVPDALLKLATVQALTGLGKTTLYTLVSRQQFPQPIRRGTRCTRWRAGDVMAWLQAQGK